MRRISYRWTKVATRPWRNDANLSPYLTESRRLISTTHFSFSKLTHRELRNSSCIFAVRGNMGKPRFSINHVQRKFKPKVSASYCFRLSIRSYSSVSNSPANEREMWNGDKFCREPNLTLSNTTTLDGLWNVTEPLQRCNEPPPLYMFWCVVRVSRITL